MYALQHSGYKDVLILKDVLGFIQNAITQSYPPILR
jgi:hypothetical protein